MYFFFFFIENNVVFENYYNTTKPNRATQSRLTFSYAPNTYMVLH